MVFNSFAFFLFFPVVAATYALLPKLFRKHWLLAASCFFYGFWEPVYVVLLLIQTTIAFTGGLAINRFAFRLAVRKTLFWISLAVLLGLLLFFKYVDFVGENATSLANWLGVEASWTTRNVLLPVGISFYTFQAISYVVDVYHKRIAAERNLVNFALYVSFFPQLVAGPIERAGDMLPQFRQLPLIRAVQLTNGLRWILLGLFKKMVVADNLAPFVDKVYNPDYPATAAEYLLATYAFSMQIYGDFSGYSDIAVGSALVLGFRLSENFRQPYFSASVAEFWRRWHVTLHTWFKDYVYIPLGGSRRGIHRTYLSIVITMVLAGLWHGAGWQFVAYALIHAASIIIWSQLSRWKVLTVIPAATRQIAGILLTFHLVCFSRIYFRSESIWQANSIVQQLAEGLIQGSSFALPVGLPLVGAAFAGVLLLMDIAKEKPALVQKFAFIQSFPYRPVAYTLLIFSILLFGVFKSSQFIYFQF